MNLHIVLVEPEIPQNTGNIIRLAANSGAHLHLVEPCGFSVGDKQLKRAGLDYHDKAKLSVHSSLAAALNACGGGGRAFAVSGKGETRYDSVAFRGGDILIFGKESVGLPEEVLAQTPPAQKLFIPMAANSRSLNLSNAVAVLVMEAWRQMNFAGAVRGAG